MRNKKALSDAVNKLNYQLRNEMYIPLSDAYQELDFVIGPDPYTYSGWNVTLRNTSVVPDIKKVIFNNPATIVIWEDGSKTVVKCKKGEEFDEWTGLAMCISKRLFGDKFHRTFKDICDGGLKK